MKQYYLAVDIGASSGRHMLAWMEDGRMCLEEVYRFTNGMEESDGHLCWNLERLFGEIVNGLAACKKISKIPISMGIDTWAVDFVLLDREGKAIGPAYGYRDKRTAGMDAVVEAIISSKELYQRTGIQKQTFNTIYQLMALKQQQPELLDAADQILMIPDYFGYLLTGKRMTEYTNATTTQLVNAWTGDWDFELIDRLGIKRSLFGPITMAGSSVGELKTEIAERVGFQLKLIQAATHDTASAVMAVPAKQGDFLYISSGTWSLMGVEQSAADCSEASRSANFTNEGGYGYRYRYLKNIMGLWMIQSVRRELQDVYSFAELCRMARECSNFPSRVDVNADIFLAPKSMIGALQDECRRTGQPVPESAGEMAAVIYQSLAKSYAETAEEIEQLTGKSYQSINIVGGGANADYLNQLTADCTGKRVCSGPTEATAVGNLTVQMIEAGVFKELSEARRVIFDSFDITSYTSEFINNGGQ